MQGTHILPNVACYFSHLAGDIICQWEVQRRLTELWEENNTLKNPRFGHFFPYINSIVVDSWFLAVGRLHDPAYSNGDANVSVDFLMEHPQLASSTKAKLEKFTPTMAAFAKVVRKPRNKLLAHNDLKSIASMGNLGAFTPGDDGNYIRCLRQFTRTVCEDICNEPFIYDDCAVNDVSAVEKALAQGIQSL